MAISKLAENVPMLDFPERECRLLLIGKAGNGKSSAGNTILGREEFQEGGGWESETKECQLAQADRFGLNVNVVDTPDSADVFQTDATTELSTGEFRRCIAMIVPGPHAIALVIGGRFTKEQVEAVDQLRQLFGEQVLDHVLVIFTHGDRICKGHDVDSWDRVIRERLETAPPELQRLITEDVGHRFVVFNNMADPGNKDRQVRKLLEMVGDIVKKIHGRSFTNQMLEDCEDTVKRFEDKVQACLLKYGGSTTRLHARQLYWMMIATGIDYDKCLPMFSIAEENGTWARSARKTKMKILRYCIYEFLREILGEQGIIIEERKKTILQDRKESTGFGPKCLIL